jgi:hypothetical protein
MSTLILNGFPLARSPYHEWVGDARQTLVLVGADGAMIAEPAQRAAFERHYAAVEPVANYALSGMVEYHAARLHERYGFERIVALSERDLIRAARLRERFGIPGQTVASAEAFRDKLLMKRLAEAGGIPVTAYAPVEYATDLHAFAERHGYPIVVKPRHGAGSVGVSVVRDREELRALVARGLSPRIMDDASTMVETFVEGAMYHVDGLVVEGELVLHWPSLFLGDQRETWERDEPLMGATVDPGDPLREPLQALLRRVLAVLPTPASTTFHCEIFRTADDRLLLSEIASRVGGVRVNDAIRLAFDGFNLIESTVKAECGVALARRPPELPLQAAGWVMIPPRAGVVEAIPAELPFPWVWGYRALAAPGQVLERATSSGEAYISFLVHAPTHAEAVARLREATGWALAHARIAPRGAA